MDWFSLDLSGFRLKVATYVPEMPLTGAAGFYGVAPVPALPMHSKAAAAAVDDGARPGPELRFSLTPTMAMAA
jgi:hypothetical protein